MKKLLVAAMGVAVAFGASADLLNAQRFEGMTQTSTDVAALNTQAGGTYWAELWATNNPPEVTNAYEITAYDGAGTPTPPDAFYEETDPANALHVKTKFNYPLSFNAVAGGTPTNINDGIYFDSLVKFTVCDSAPEQDYSGAKIVMWLQEDEDLHKTNIVVKAGFLSVGENGIEVSDTVYTCGDEIGSDFADKWHRVTIKSIANITKSELSVPGFAIYIDGNPADTLDAKWDSSFTSAHALTYTATQLGGALFPSLVQGANGTEGKDTVTSVAFDGTGWLNDLVFTDTAPDFAEDPVEPIANTMTVKIGDAEPVEVTDFAAAVALASEQTSGTAVTIKPLMDVTLTAPVVISGEADIVLDFAGYVITNTMADAVITNSANLVITNSSVTLGGIYCTEVNGCALAAVGGTTTINAGMFNGLIIMPATGLAINGGYFKQTYLVLEPYMPETKILEYDPETELQKVVDYVPAVYTITFNTVGGAFADPEEATQEVTEGNYVQKPNDPIKLGARFVKWVWDHDCDGGDETPMVEFIFDGDPEERQPTEVLDDCELFAEWAVVPEYTVTFRTNGVEFATQNVTSNSTASAPLPAPTAATGYTFGGWYEGDSAYDFDTPVTGDLTLDAKYTANTYKVTFYTNSVEYAVVNYTYADESSYNAPANPSVDGYTFGGWYTDDGEFKIAFVFDENVADNTQVAYAKLTGLSPVTPVVPGEDITPPTGKTAEQYAGDINTAIAAGKGADYITVPTEAASTSASYLRLLKAQVNDDKIDIVFNEEAAGYAAVTNAIETVAIPAVGAALPDVAAGKAASTSNVSIASGLTPGLYYSISYCTDLADFDTVDEDEGTRVKADASGAATLTTPEKKSATQGFYRVNVNVSE